jgi:hypothetical protein
MTFTYRLALADGNPADPPSMQSAVPRWRVGDTIPIRPGRTFRVLAIVVSEDDEPSVLVVEDAAR